MSGKMLSFVGLLIAGMLFVGMIGCAPKAEEAEVQEGVVQPAAEEVGRVFTDADFVEFLAQVEAISVKYEKNPIKGYEELTKLYKRHAEILGQYDEWVANWQQRAIAEPETAGKQWEDMMQQVEKRAAELIK